MTLTNFSRSDLLPVWVDFRFVVRIATFKLRGSFQIVQ
jgi:hypothetical protein